MVKKAATPKTVDEYIAQFPPELRSILERLRAVVREAAPVATERIAYGMPAFTQNGPIVYFAAHKRHIGLYPLPTAVEAFRDRLAPYANAKGSVQFPIDQELPFELIREIVKFRVEEDARKAAAKKKR
jgi:uncharacterized protein YdhG (YjbR/CyaY superfamily)